MWRAPVRFGVAAARGHVHFIGDFLMEFLKFAGSAIRPLSSAKVVKGRPQ